MWYNELFDRLEGMYDEEQSKKMSAYMQNLFPFLGIPKPKLTETLKPYLKEARKQDFDRSFVDICWEKDYREAQYVGLSYLALFEKKLQKDDLEWLQKLIVTKSWWETVDTLDAFVGTVVYENKELEKVMLEWSLSENIWLRRVSINFQQRFKENTNTELLSRVITNNLGSTEFFINKAIGWSLREYSKTNPEWVKNFISKHEKQMNKLSVKEAGKYL